MTGRIAAAICAAALTGAAVPATAGEVIAQTYTCERGVAVPVVYVNAEDGTDFAVVVLMIEGRMINLQAVPEAASGVRYRFPNDGSGYVWWTHQGKASLYWRDGATAEETPLYTDCTPG